MKRIKFLLLTLVIAAFSCSKQAEGLKEESKTEFEASSFKATGDMKYIVYCSGSCANGDCETVKDMNNKKFSCSCESDNCAMIVEILNGINEQIALVEGEEANELIQQMTSGRELFFTYLDAYILETYGESAYTIKKVTLVVNDEESILQYEFMTATGLDKSVIFVDKVLEGKKFRVSCNGHCDNAVNKCVEEFGFGSTSINCSCQSDNCYMIVEELQPSQG